MTRNDLIVLAKAGKAHIRLSDTLERYAVTDDSVDTGAASVFIYVNVSTEDGYVYEDAMHEAASGLVEKFELTEEETDILASAIDAMPQ